MLKNDDIEDLKNLLQISTMPAKMRHQRLYKIVLRAYNRTISDYSKDERILIVDDGLIGFLEKRLFIAEWKHPRMTILSSFVVPFLRWIIKRRKD